jgi:hypothetical protein
MEMEVSSVRGRAITVFFAATLIAACGNGDAAPASETAASTIPLPDTSSVPSTAATPTVPAPPKSTTAEPVRDLLDPWPATEIDWQSVGSGWVLFTYAVPDTLDDPQAEFDVTLMLLSPNGQTYKLGHSTGPYTLSHDVQDLSADGRTALVASYGDEATSYSLLDLPTMSMTTISTTPAAWRVQFGGDDQSLLIEEQFTAPEPSGAWLVNRITLSRAAVDGTNSELLVDLPLTSEQQQLASFFSYVELESREYATTEAGTGWLRSPDGQPIRQLQLPSDQCTLVKQWSHGMILARCPDTFAEVGCWTSGLFLIPTTGEPASEFSIPTGEFSCFAGYSNAVALGDRVALQRGQGEGECTEQIELIDANSTVIWAPDDDQPCNATLLGIRNEAWLAHVGPLHGTSGSQYQGPGVLYEIINPLGDSGPLTPTTLPSSWNSPGVLSNVQIIGS